MKAAAWRDLRDIANKETFWNKSCSIQLTLTDLTPPTCEEHKRPRRAIEIGSIKEWK